MSERGGQAAPAPAPAPSRSRGRRALAVLGPLALYAALAVLFWFVPIASAPRDTLIASDAIDANSFMWMLAWWPHALGEGLNPFLTEHNFAPEGFNLAWAASMPLPALLLAPVTETLGAEVTWNLLALLAPALSAWAAYALCERITRGAVLPSLVGGFLFGFSPYMLGHIAGAPNLAMVALLPVAALLVVRHAQGTLRTRWFVVLMALTVAAQLLTWSETLAMATVFGAVAMGVAYALVPAWRAGLRRTLAPLAGAYAAAGVLTAPFLFHFFFEDYAEPTQGLEDEPVDVLSFVVPTEWMLVATGHTPEGVPDYADGFPYLGLPLLALVGLFAWRERARPAARFLLVCALVAVLATLGAELAIRGEATGVPLPWAAVEELPLLKYAIPVRQSLFVFLAVAVMVALLLARHPSPLAWVLAALAVVFFLPDVGNPQWKEPLSAQPFFDPAVSRPYVRPGDRVMAIPTWAETQRWQVEDDYRWELAGGYLGAFPASYRRYSTFETMLSDRLGPDAPADLRRFLRDKGVTVIVVDERRSPRVLALLDGLGVKPVRVGGARVYRLAPPRRG